tara:strand:+ start:670 stop:870 length:201 start_codon:yes stop_codon:yes gene_type:complete
MDPKRKVAHIMNEILFMRCLNLIFDNLQWFWYYEASEILYYSQPTEIVLSLFHFAVKHMILKFLFF